MQFFLQRISSYSGMQLKNSFSEHLLILQSPYLPQKKLKNLILKKQFNLTETGLLEATQVHQVDSDFFSASYSGDWLFLGISKQKVGVDLEMIKPRDSSLLQKYSYELETYFGKGDWTAFYLLRTAKEAILKASDSNDLELIDHILLLSVENKHQKIWNLDFGRELTFLFQGQDWKVQSAEDGEKARSIALLP